MVAEQQITDNPRPSLPMRKSNIFSQISFWWVNDFVRTGFKRPLEDKDIWKLEKEYTAEEVNQHFEEEWRKEVEITKRKRTKLHQGGPSLSNVFFRMYWKPYLLCCLFKLIADIFTLSTPHILKKLIESVKIQSEGKTTGIFYSFMLFFVLAIQNYIHQQYFWRCYTIGLCMKSVVISAVYKKILRLNNNSRAKYSSGKLVNFISIDAERCYTFITYLVVSWSAPFLILTSLVFLYQIIGPSMIAGVLVIFLSNPLNYFITKIVTKYNRQMMKYKDKRTKLISEVVAGIKIIKMYTWEGSYIQRISQVRKDELKLIRKVMMLDASWSFSINCLPFMVSVATFATYIYLFNGNLTAEKAFVSIAFFNIMRYPFSIIPYFFNSIVNYKISAERLSTFFEMEELDKTSILKLPLEMNNEKGGGDPSVEIGNGNFTWDPELITTTLQDINFKADTGKLVAIVGRVGEGKTSLLSAILGEIQKLSGTITTHGNIAYVAQEAWIQNQSLRQNILFGKGYRSEKYKSILKACSLETDIGLLPASDLTEIGEKGINLSGGQKQRVSLARAVYNDADVYLLDDPLSAVDTHVGKHIFDHVIGPKGILRQKTRILVTHNLSFLPKTDYVFVIQNNTIVEQGTYNALMKDQNEFSKFCTLYMRMKEEEDGEIMLEENYDTKDNSLKSTTTEQMSATFSGYSTLGNNDSTILLHCNNNEGGIVETTLHNIYQVIDEIPDEKLFSEEDNEKKFKNIKGNITEKETSETGNVSIRFFKMYLKTLGVCASIVILSCGLLQEASLVASRFWLAHWSSISGQKAYQERNFLIGIYGLLGFGQGLFILVLALCLALTTFSSSKKLHFKLLQTIVHCPMSFFDTTPSGRILNRFTKDIGSLDYQLPRNLQSFLSDGMGLVGTIYIISFATPMVLVAFIPIAVVYVFTQRAYVKTSKQLKRILAVNQSPIYNHLIESINGLSTIRAFSKQPQFVQENHQRIDQLQGVFFASIMCDRWLLINIKMLGNLVAFFTSIFCVIGKSHISPGILGMVVSYAIQMTSSLISLVRSSNQLENSLVSIERLNDYSSKPTEDDGFITDGKNPPQGWPQQGEITFENYSVRYRSCLDLVLKNINITFKPNEKVGIVGRTGAGKSSITLALFRILEPAHGSIIIDGVNVCRQPLKTLRRNISIIPQDPVLFSETIRFNLDPFNTFEEHEIWRALEISHLKDFVSSLPNGIESEIQEGGQNFSVGQRQLLCLARALLRKTKILVLDEATAAVDMETDSLIQETVRKEFKNCTILTIAHRLNTILDYDKIVVMDKGEVVEFDEPKYLLSDETSLFHGMVNSSGTLH